MVMKGVTKYFKPGEAEVRALIAGNDVLERLVSVPRAILAIKQAIRQRRLSWNDINRRCKKVLAAKYWVGLDNYRPVVLDSLYADLHPSRAYEINRRLAEGSITLLQNKRQLLPLAKNKKNKIAVLALGARRATFFQNKMREATSADLFTLPRRSTKKDLTALQKKLKSYNLVVLAIYGPSIRPSNNLGFSPEDKAFINKLISDKKCVVTLFDNAYALNQFADIGNANALLVGYQQLPSIQEAAVKLIFGDIKPNGKLPVTVNKDFKFGDGL
jgi:hypothetical protein